MIRKVIFFLLLVITMHLAVAQDNQSWIRINLLGYQPKGTKVAVWCSRESSAVSPAFAEASAVKRQSPVGKFQLIDVITGKVEFEGTASKSFGAYGPFTQTCRLDFSAVNREGRFVLHAGGTTSPEFTIAANVYDGAADFCLRYMRQQRSGFNPFLKDSCHTHDGYTLYAPVPDSTYIDVTGGWHDASDYLQYATTSANATYHLLMAYRDFPNVFTDKKLANGLDGSNGMADVLDEAKWGLDWLLKMHPKDAWLFNQLGDDRDHRRMRIPKEDTNYYGKGLERPVYFCNGLPQVRGKFKNNTTGVASTAGKFASAFALGSQLFLTANKSYSATLAGNAVSAFQLGKKKPGVSQTASVLSPYIYAEDNWTDDMELASVSGIGNYESKEHINEALVYARQETVTPWLGTDTAKHYQWYPFINIGHYELAKKLKGKQRDTVTGYYKEGIQRVWKKAQQNAFYRGVPFIWCSNNLTTSFAIQCYWYRELSKDNSFAELEQANFDWLFGCNPWGTSFVYGLPAMGDTPDDPHSAFTHLKHYPIDGGLVDGPVYGSIYKSLIGITLHQPDEYAPFQSDLVVYHDDYGDYSTNEPTMDGTASLIYLLAAKQATASPRPPPVEGVRREAGRAITRGDTTQKKIAVVFTGDEFAEGGDFIIKTFRQHNTKASFFFTGRFYRNAAFKNIIQQLKKDGHYLGAHSNDHLLYCDWNKRDSLLVTQKQFDNDLLKNYAAMSGFGIKKKDAGFFLPPYEWYNDTIASWTKAFGLQLINFTPGTRSNADYTAPGQKNYKGSQEIYDSIIQYEKERPAGLNGFILLVHIGAGPKRTDKFYRQLPLLLAYLKAKQYRLVTIPDLLK